MIEWWVDNGLVRRSDRSCCEWCCVDGGEVCEVKGRRKELMESGECEWWLEV